MGICMQVYQIYYRLRQVDPEVWRVESGQANGKQGFPSRVRAVSKITDIQTWVNVINTPRSMDKEMRALGKSTVPQPNMSHLSVLAKSGGTDLPLHTV